MRYCAFDNGSALHVGGLANGTRYDSRIGIDVIKAEPPTLPWQTFRTDRGG